MYVQISDCPQELLRHKCTCVQVTTEDIKSLHDVQDILHAKECVFSVTDLNLFYISIEFDCCLI